MPEPVSALLLHLAAHPAEPVPPELAASWRAILGSAAAGVSWSVALSHEKRRQRRALLARLLAEVAPGASLWAGAVVMSRELRKFSQTAYPRIKSGHREPRDECERVMFELLQSGCPRSVKQLRLVLDNGSFPQNVSVEPVQNLLQVSQ